MNAITKKMTAAQIVAIITATATKTPANARRVMEAIRADFVNMRGFKYEGAQNAEKTIKNTTGAELEEVKAQLDHISAAFATLKVKGHESYISKVAGLMKANINNNARFELARKEAAKEAAKVTTPSTVTA